MPYNIHNKFNLIQNYLLLNSQQGTPLLEMYFDSSSLDNAMIYRSARLTAWRGGSRARDRAGWRWMNAHQIRKKKYVPSW